MQSRTQHLFAALLAAAAVACLITACGGEDDPSGTADVSDADLSTGDMASGDDTTRVDTFEGETSMDGCHVEPHCSLFRNDGSQGGSVQVSISADGRYAIVETNALPEHPTGPYADGNPNQATAQHFTWQIPLEPQPGPTDTALGSVAVLYDGTTIFNPSDARDFAGCTGNAGYIEVGGLDAYGGHPQQQGVYHLHAGTFLGFADELGLSHQPGRHASLLGFAPDGYPIYGPWGYADPMDPDSGIELLTSCFQLKAERDCCTDEFVCGIHATYEFGPNSIQLGMGAFLEDFELDQAALDRGDCDLDAYNMRFQVTPEFPEGTHAYIVAVEDDGSIEYPYILGLQYYGAVDTDLIPGRIEGGGMMPPP